MKRILNTLYVTADHSYLSRKGEGILVRVEDEVKLHVPVHTLESIVCFGHVMCSPGMLGLCAERGVTVSFLSMNGRFLARMEGPVSGNVLLRRQQYRHSEQSPADIARQFVLAKLVNSRAVLLRTARDRSSAPGTKPLRTAALTLKRMLRQLNRAADADSLRGLEGQAAHAYFSAFDHLISAQKEDFVFRFRSRRPPLNPINALLSFLYTLLVHDVRSALETVGLDPAVGFLHTDRPGRPSLALDLMEELRAYMADRLVLSMINRKQLGPQHFESAPGGAHRMTDKGRKIVLTTWQKRKQDAITHPFLGEKMHLGLLPFTQALLMARFLRGDLDAYPPFLSR
jgi:CRISPR-associated protein Cas1